MRLCLLRILSPLGHRTKRIPCEGKHDVLSVPEREAEFSTRKFRLQFTKLHVVCIVGGLSLEKQMRLLAKGPEIIVATPGRLFELVQEDPQLQNQLVSVKCLVVDEADRMIQKVRTSTCDEGVTDRSDS